MIGIKKLKGRWAAFYVVALLLLDITLIAKIVHSKSLAKNLPQQAQKNSTNSQTLGVKVDPTNTPVPPTVIFLSPTQSIAPPTNTPTQAPFPTSTPTPIKSGLTSHSQDTPSISQPQTQTSNSAVVISNSSSQENEFLNALNKYRQEKGVAALSIDTKLSDFAKNRAEYFNQKGGMDNHAGFQSMMSDNGFEKMGFDALGENSSFGDFKTPLNLIEGIFKNHAPHDENQLNPEWTHVGIGVSGVATDFVFGGRKK